MAPQVTEVVPPALEPLAPAWVGELIGAVSSRLLLADRDRGLQVRGARAAAFSHLTATLSEVTDLEQAVLEDRVAGLYRALIAELAQDGRSAIRFWNYIPQIHARMGELDRYMVFNAGRFNALAERHGAAMFPRALSTASAVGIEGRDLVVHCLAGTRPGMPLENPRQIPAYAYSSRYGPRPPCFARATVVERPFSGGTLILVAGTASIRGEATMHPGDIGLQANETFENLAALVAASRDAGANGTRNLLGCFRDLRVHVVRPTDGPVVMDAVAKAFTGLKRVEVVRADLCRPDLLVEIEGIAEGLA